ncbi:MLO-like protein 10 [Rutidosis leptorrhynchoides]|uniref:MLO-like protein 10 n=1 Tax=Rutidosis leptorrhynchoides TaxID=125765 RepID=UPI003A99F93D
MAGETSEGTRELDQTPTWAVAGVCAVIIIISIALEKILYRLGKVFTDKHKKALFEALEKVKAELMILGFISLILTFSQYYIAKICIPIGAADTMLPCAKKHKVATEGAHRLLLWYENRRSLAGAPASSCPKGKVPIITVDGLHQLHILIFFLAVFHVAYSAITMALGRLKTRGWKQWEEETSTHDYEFSNDPSRFRLTHETSFVRAHTSFWTRIPFFFYIGCFFRQFFRSVTKSDYMTLRNGFINLHLAPGTKFNFQKYIKRSLEDDFQVVVGVSPVLWASFVIFLLLNVNGWQAMFWASIIPLIIILAVGTQLQAILTKMAIEITERHAVVQGIPLVQASDKYFWFSKPRLILHLIHFVLFQNAFQITYFFWIWYEYKINSCFHDNMKLVILKLVIGVGVLIMCSYITLPLYALLSQMGSNMKKSIFDEQTAKALKQWRMAVKKKHGGKGGKTPTRSTATSVNASPVHPMASAIYPTAAATLHRFKTTGHSTRSSNYDDNDVSDFEAEPLSPDSSTRHLMDVRSDNEIEVDHSTEQVRETRHEDDFSFAKPAPPLL